jgi:hypothetical protein
LKKCCHPEERFRDEGSQPTVSAQFFELWCRNKNCAAKIMAGKKPARGCCVARLYVALAFMPAPAKIEREKHPSLKEEKWQ